MTFLVAALVADTAINVRVIRSAGGLRFNLELAGAGDSVFFAMVIAVVFLVGMNWILYLRDQSFRHRLLKLAENPNLDQSERQRILEILMEMRH